ncbi:hypothetical protein LSAT2_024892 [Lamellibrachia satsuma]|nr:hypothetical protein LSAT2_024892 [Lamellibrachia satsuma]
MSGAPLTNDEEYFWRLVRILLQDVPGKLRDLFRNKFQERFHVAWGDNETSGEFFIANSNTGRTGQHIIDTIRQGDTASFDCTALFTCLLYSRTGILLPTPRRGVRTHPIHDSERVDDLREMRNELAHATSTSLPRATFIQKLASINTIYAQLQWNPTVMRQWARDPVVTAECVRLQHDLDAERQRYRGLDTTVQALDVTMQDHEQRLRNNEQILANHAATQQQHARDISQQQSQQRQLQEQQNKQDEDISHLQQQLPRAPHQQVKDELQTWRSLLKVAQRRSLERYVRKTNVDENTTFQNLSEMFIDLRLQSNADNYKRLETRTHYDNLQLQMESNSCTEIEVADLFKAGRPDMTTPVRSLVVGKAGIGKTMLSMHIADLWLENELLPDDIDHLFLFHLRNLSGIDTCSLEDLFFKYQDCEMPSTDAIAEFFKQLSADPDKTLLILDGMDEITIEPEKKEKFAYNAQVAVPKLIASIINGCVIPSTRVLVTSRPGGFIEHDAYDKKAEIYGFTREKMSVYIETFSGGNRNLQNSIEEYIDQNVNVCSFCYIPVHLNMVCRIVKLRMQIDDKQQFPETLTELFVGFITNFLTNHHLKFRNADKTKVEIAQLEDSILNHAKMARYGMEQVPIRVIFSQDNVHDYHLEKDAMRCGLMTKSRETVICSFTPTVKPVYYFQHLTLHEFLAAVALATDFDFEGVKRMLTSASDRQLDLMVMFLAGLLGNSKNHKFIGSLHNSLLNSSVQVTRRKRATSVESLLEIVVAREQSKEARLGDEDKAAAHKVSTLLLMMIMYESQQPDLWRHMSHYVLKGSKELNLESQHISSTELHSLAYVLPGMDITALNLRKCGLTGKEAENVLVALGRLPQLTQLRLSINADLHGPAVTTALRDSLARLTRLEELDLDLCNLTNEDATELVPALSKLRCLKQLQLRVNCIGDSGADNVTKAVVTLPSLEILGLSDNWLTDRGIDLVRRAVHCSTPRGKVELAGLDLQRPPREEVDHPDEVVHWQHQVTNFQVCLSRLNGRPLEERDTRWGREVDQAERVLNMTQDTLRLAQRRTARENVTEADRQLDQADDSLHVHSLPVSGATCRPLAAIPPPHPNGAGIQSMACVKSALRPRIWSVTSLESNVLTAKLCRNTFNLCYRRKDEQDASRNGVSYRNCFRICCQSIVSGGRAVARSCVAREAQQTDLAHSTMATSCPPPGALG